MALSEGLNSIISFIKKGFEGNSEGDWIDDFNRDEYERGRSIIRSSAYG